MASLNDTVFTAYTMLKEGDHELKDIVLAELSEAEKTNLLTILPQEVQEKLLSPRARTVLEIVREAEDEELAASVMAQLSNEEARLVGQLR